MLLAVQLQLQLFGVIVTPRASPPRLVATAAPSTNSAERVCSPGTLASRIEDAVFQVYGGAGTERVRRSLEAINTDEFLDRPVGESGHELMVQQARSWIDGLSATPWHDAYAHKWAKKLKQKWAVVRDELRGQLATGDALAEVGTNVWDATAPGDYGVEWKTLPLCDRTVWDATNSALFPRTCELLQACKVPLIEAFFAKMEPHSDIKPHSDGCNFVLTSHLGVDVPEGQCDLTVGDTTVEWRNGEVTLFDTSILHKAENRADVTRYILMLRVYHPELTAAERAALQLTFDCLDEPELLDDAEALGEYELRRRHLEAESRKPWEAALAQKGFAKKGGKKKKR